MSPPAHLARTKIFVSSATNSSPWTTSEVAREGRQQSRQRGGWRSQGTPTARLRLAQQSSLPSLMWTRDGVSCQTQVCGLSENCGRDVQVNLRQLQNDKSFVWILLIEILCRLGCTKGDTGIGVQSKPVLTNYNVIPEARGGEYGEGGAPENCSQGGEHGRRSRRPQVQLHWEQVQLQKGVKAMQLPLP